MRQLLKIELFFSPMIATRVSASEFLQNHIHTDAREVVLDFSNINFISRSATDEFITFFEQNKLNYCLINQTENIERMFQAVRKTHVPRKKRSFREIPVVSFNSESELNDFLAVL